jgi:thymidylate synthase
MYIYIFQGLGVPFNIASYSLLTYMYIYIFQGLGVPFNIASYSLLTYMYISKYENKTSEWKLI